MGKELRMANIYTTDTATANNVGNFQNTTNDMISIRRISLTAYIDAVAPGEHVVYELGKSPALVGTTNGATIPFVQCAAPSESATVTGNDVAVSEHFNFPDGALTLEPNEALYLNVVVDGTLSANGTAQIWYHF